MSEAKDIVAKAARELLKDARAALSCEDNEQAHADFDRALREFVAAVSPKTALKLDEMRANGPSFWYA